MAKESLYVDVVFNTTWMNGYMTGSGRTWSGIRAALVADMREKLKEISPSYRIVARASQETFNFGSNYFDPRRAYGYVLSMDDGRSRLPKDAHVKELRAKVDELTKTHLSVFLRIGG